MFGNVSPLYGVCEVLSIFLINVNTEIYLFFTMFIIPYTCLFLPVFIATDTRRALLITVCYFPEFVRSDCGPIQKYYEESAVLPSLQGVVLTSGFEPVTLETGTPADNTAIIILRFGS